MNYLSVCSGIEAATVAWHDLGFNPVGFSEIEPFPAAALKHHYPNVTNFGDMTKYKEWNLEPNTVDLLVGGTPCQSFSVAGLRKGLDDPRGNLALVYCGMLDYFRPKWFVWENVPGVLSSSGGRDFGSFLGAVAELGYGFSYRVLDAQYFGVAQRRRRVFVVGHLGSWQRPAAVLFERESLCRNTAPSREAGKEVARIVAPSLTASNDPSRSPQSSEVTQQIAAVVAATFDRQSSGEYGTAPVASTVAARDYKSPSDLVAQPIAFQSVDHGADATVDLSPTIRSHDPMAVAHPVKKELPLDPYLGGEVTITIDASYSKGCGGTSAAERPVVADGMAVRRLTPVECERLQGFSDSYTMIPWRKKPASECPDGPRYKALGNSMAVPVMKWIGSRIKMVDELC